MKKHLTNRVKSLMWRAGAMALVAFIAYVGENLDAFEMTPQMITVVGLILGEVTKFLNTYLHTETDPATL